MMSVLSFILPSAVGAFHSEEVVSYAANCVAVLRGARAALDRSLTPGGSYADHVNVPLTKQQVAMLMVLIDRELPKID